MKNFCPHENAKNDLKRCQDHAKATGGNIHEEILISIKIPTNKQKKSKKSERGQILVAVVVNLEPVIALPTAQF